MDLPVLLENKERNATPRDTIMVFNKNKNFRKTVNFEIA